MNSNQTGQDSEQRYQRLLAAVTDYVFSVTVDDGRPVATSHGPGCEAVTGFTQAEFDADPFLWFHMVYEEDRPAVTARAEQILRGEAPPALEHRIVRKDGSIRWIRNTAVPRKDAGGRVVMYDGLVSDITDRKRAEDELRKAYGELTRHQKELDLALQELEASNEELKAAQLQLIQAAKLESVGTLAAGVAHEVKNPLQTILMGLDYLHNNLPASNGNMKQVLGDMRDAVTRANAIIQELLQLSAQREFELKREDLNLLLERALSLLNNEFIASRIKVVKRLGAKLPAVRIDRGKMEQVFINLFINAVQAMSTGGVLTVATTVGKFSGDLDVAPVACPQFHRGDPVVIAEVQDTGTGIAEEHLPRIFDPFFTTKPVGVGVGLGLSVVKKIVDFHCGAIGIKNASGGGVLATVVLKAEPDDPPDSP
ncbi:MAG: sensor histidine kinase [Limisphaerales bacterium]